MQMADLCAPWKAANCVQNLVSLVLKFQKMDVCHELAQFVTETTTAL